MKSYQKWLLFAKFPSGLNIRRIKYNFITQVLENLFFFFFFFKKKKQVNQNHQGRYTCTPYNAQGTQGSSGPMEVLVRKPPVFVVEPESLYQKKVGETVEMHCEVQEAEGTQKPIIQWQRVRF